MHGGSGVDLAVSDFELSKLSTFSDIGLHPTVTIRLVSSDTSSHGRNSSFKNTPDSASKTNRYVKHVGRLSDPGGSFDVEGVDALSVIDVVGGSGTPNLLMITARDLLKFSVSGFPMSVVIVSLPVVSSWVVIVDTSSEVDEVVGVSGPDSTVVTHGDVEESVVLLVEDVAPAVTLGGGLGNTGSVVSVTFLVDTDELGVVARVDLDKSVTRVVLDQGPTFFDVIGVLLDGDFTLNENPNIILRIDSPDDSFFSRRDQSLESIASLLPIGTSESRSIRSVNTQSLIDFVVHVDGPISPR